MALLQSDQHCSAKKSGSLKAAFFVHSEELLTQIHAAFFVQLAEIGISQVFYKADGFAGTFHFGAQFLVHIREFVKAEHRLFDGKTVQLLSKVKSVSLFSPIIILVAMLR